MRPFFELSANTSSLLAPFVVKRLARPKASYAIGLPAFRSHSLLSASPRKTATFATPVQVRQLASLPNMTAQITFYKRPLPDSCINFNSPEGKRLFANALRDGLTESYFLLAGQFVSSNAYICTRAREREKRLIVIRKQVTQNEPAYCALGTLCMVLNAYEVDPQRIFRGVWRFYDQDMLSCCRPLEDVAAVGLTLPEFGCLARCNGLNTTIVSPRLEPESRTAGLERFRRDLKESAQGKATLALSYSRKTLGQTVRADTRR